MKFLKLHCNCQAGRTETYSAPFSYSKFSSINIEIIYMNKICTKSEIKQNKAVPLINYTVT
jgi:hypothetical protein